MNWIHLINIVWSKKIRKFGQENLNQSKPKPSTLFRATGKGSRPPPISTTVSLEESQSTSVEEANDSFSTTLEDGQFNQDFDNFDIVDDAEDINGTTPFQQDWTNYKHLEKAIYSNYLK